MKTVHRIATSALLACSLYASTAAAEEPTAGAASAATPASPGSAASAASPGTAPAPLDINLATAQEFEKLPHVGPSRAQAIVKMRERMGGFRRLEDLMRVRGIGRKTFRQLQPMVTFGQAPKAHGDRPRTTKPRS